MSFFDTSNLFADFGFSSTPKERTRPNVHIRFGSESQLNEVEASPPRYSPELGVGPGPGNAEILGHDVAVREEPVVENGGTTEENSISSGVQTIDEVNCTLEESASQETSSSKFCQFLEKIGFKDPSTCSFNEKLEFVINSYDNLTRENEKLKELLSTSSSTHSTEKIEAENNDLFVIDTKLGASCFKNKSHVSSNDEYSHKTDINEDSPVKSKVECYNCDGDHVLSECTKTLDHKKIRAKKRQAYQKNGKDKEGKKRYAEEQTKFKPGHVSQELRGALGLRSRDIPMWIYQMRVLGYPPGYLKEAFHEPSNITMFDDDGCPMKLKNEKRSKGYYDPNKIIDYPGFNCPLPGDVKDHCMELNMPPMLPHHQKHAFLQYLNGDDPAMNETECLNGLNQKHDVIEDMEVEEIDEKDESSCEIVDEIQSPESPGTDQLQQERDRILAELEMSSLNGSGHVTSKSLSRLNSTSAPSGRDDPNESMCTVDEICGEDSQSRDPEIQSRDQGIASRDLATPSRDPESTLSEGELESSRQTPTDFFRDGSSSIRKFHSAQSLSMELGTPVSITPRSADQSPLDVPRYEQKPNFEAFAYRIVKFEVKEQSIPCRGVGMKRLKEILRKNSMKK